MPTSKRKTGARKKAHKQRLRQKEIRSRASTRSLADHPSTCVMVSANSKRNGAIDHIHVTSGGHVMRVSSTFGWQGLTWSKAVAR